MNLATVRQTACRPTEEIPVVREFRLKQWTCWDQMEMVGQPGLM
jgi:hypothetical protein